MDFFSGAGTLAQADLMNTLSTLILEPRSLDYKIVCTQCLAASSSRSAAAERSPAHRGRHPDGLRADRAVFHFEEAGLVPDMVCLSKGIGGYGCPLSLKLIRPELDVWRPCEHNGTFRRFNVAFVTGAKALRSYWSDDKLERSTRADHHREGLTILRNSVLAALGGE